MINSFIKWAGGKSQLLTQIEPLLPILLSNCKKFNYIEPFVGGGSFLFYIIQKYKEKINKIIINDINSKLINVYIVIKNNPNGLINHLTKIKEDYLLSTNKKDFYIEIRYKFNYETLTDVELASYFIFLNKTCFNGLYRENKNGKFNVPFGSYKNPGIFSENNIKEISGYLQKVEILNTNYNQINLASLKNDVNFFYFDPPYKPLSKTSSFNSYVSQPFNDNEQIELKNYIDKINCDNNFIMLSNSGHDFFYDLYNKYFIHEVLAKRNINSKKEKRGAIKELIITNY